MLSDRDWVEVYSHAQPLYEQLCVEVAYILRRALKKRELAVAHISHRVKELKSILEKVQRKGNIHSLADVSDLGGVRVVHLYRDDTEHVDQVIGDEFTVLQRQDKRAEMGAQQFGYGGFHYLVRLSEGSAGARYDDLRDLVCEIQTRTVAQDAWAVMSHELVYKHETEVPDAFRRQLSALAAVFEMADDDFDQLRRTRSQYLAHLSATASEGKLSDEELNLDSLSLLLAQYFDIDVDMIDRRHASAILRCLEGTPYTTIESIYRALVNTVSRRQLYFHKEEGAPGATEQLAVALALLNRDCRNANWAWGWDGHAMERLETLSKESD
jgi:putative GTP pyrophosphokinase